MKTAIGLMSGTSMDGIDVALVRTDGEQQVDFGEYLSIDYPAHVRRQIEWSLEHAKTIEVRTDRPGGLGELEVEITNWHADAVHQFLEANNLSADSIDVIGFHGQTVLHRPEQALTVQLGLGEMLAQKTGIDVVYDMRANDMLNGGQGAPLVPVFHQAISMGMEIEEPVCFVNIGGISNVSYVNGEALVAFDTGPGNALIDQWVQRAGGIPYDQGGRIASEGGIVAPVLQLYLDTPYFKEKGTKSLDRNDFPPLEDDCIELSDGARTLARLSAEAVILGQDNMPQRPKNWIICGGGRLNQTIMSELRELADRSSAKVWTADDLNLQGDMLEAQAFAYLAVRNLKGLPLTFPTTTGCNTPTTGGVLAKA